MTIINRTWRVTFTERAFGNQDIVYVNAPTKLLALWTAREFFYGCSIRHPDYAEKIGLVRKAVRR
jgi:hypothetical protein